MNEEKDEEFVGFEELDSRRLRAIDLIILPACFIQLVAEAAAMTLEKLVILLAGHANYDTDQRRFAEAIRADLESIPTTEE